MRSKRITSMAKAGLKIVLVALLLTALSSEVFARSGSSGRGREGDSQGAARSSSSSIRSIDERGQGRNREEKREARAERAVIQSGRDIVEDRIMLVAEPMATASEVKLKLEFPAAASTTNQIAQETLNRMRLSREEIDRLLIVEQAEAADNFSASLKGNEEVPAVVTVASGTADFELQRSDTRLAFILNVTNIENATAAHIHQGTRGENGPVIASLFTGPTKTGRFSGILAQGIIEVQDLVGPLTGRPFSDLVDLLRSGRVYTNVHTAQNSAGEIRGQIMTLAQDEQINERLRVRANVKEDMTKVKADFRFAVASTTRAQIIDHIFARLSALRLDDILNILELRIMAESRCDVVMDNDDDRRRPNRGRR